MLALKEGNFAFNAATKAFSNYRLKELVIALINQDLLLY